MKKSTNPILTICVPTYNRAKELNYNLSLLERYICDGNLIDKVCVLVSNNQSPDNTYDVINSFEDRGNLHLLYFEQKENIGSGPNVVYCVEKATTPWVMLLGDDDYLEPWYISECLKQIEEHPNLGCIIPNSIAYNPLNGEYGKTRETVTEDILYWSAGFQACLNNAHYGHSLSGLCFRHDLLFKKLENIRLENLYPQIYFVAFNALHYDVLHFRRICLKISDVPQSYKDWRYGEDGLINDIFENYKKLGVPYKQRALLEANFLKNDPRYMWATENINLCIEKILTGKNVSLLGRYYIAKQILADKVYTGKRLRLSFYLLARFVLLRNFLTGKPIVI